MHQSTPKDFGMLTNNYQEKNIYMRIFFLIALQNFCIASHSSHVIIHCWTHRQYCILWEILFCTKPSHGTLGWDGQQDYQVNSQVLTLKSALLNYDQRYSLTFTPFISLMFMSAPFSTRYSTVLSRLSLTATCRAVC